ncbi:hypothetical protein GGP41_008844 [Bipolaris sorokiniana]|uniref:Uncharacterized protein n=2 Tax=Cochliobolus sativus TaxID=45130 RepID=A0A8H5Z8R8_COCSA|nr:uncharacterized protein COCSADRAFT_168058 [Bipolaris sorokiniana ND90Pr]EMD68858.1 hypothetical protein COCSADRAFT_168058 [Bipolaris sorokiniana ND90Pr]KAF5844881.1 hypothetical protein GGP41_008844 [Bipolaris sorokiniana]
MPIFRTLTTKLKTSLSASSSPDTTPVQSPISPQASSPSSSFERLGGRKQGSGSMTAVDATAGERPQVQERTDSFMTHHGGQGSNESVVEKKMVTMTKRTSRFREELDFEAEE